MRNRAVKIQFWFWTKIFCHQDREVVILFTSVFSCLLLKKMPLPSSFFFFFLFFLHVLCLDIRDFSETLFPPSL